MMVGSSSLGTGGAEPFPGRPILGLFCQCPLGMSMALFIGLSHYHFCYFCPNFKRRCWGGRCHTSPTLIIHWSIARLATSPCPPLVALSATSVGDLAVAESLASKEPTSVAWKAPILVTPYADGASQGTADVDVDGASPQLCDDAGGLLQDLVKHCAGIDVPRSATLGDAAPTPRCLGTTGPGLSRLNLPSSVGFLPSPID
jgi:hypothetical protein